MFGCNVVMVMGITDVDDKIIRRANEVSVGHAAAWSFDRGVGEPHLTVVCASQDFSRLLSTRDP